MNEQATNAAQHDMARAVEVIQTSLTRRGNGTTTPIRVVTQYWAKNGTLLAELDPSPEEPRTIQLLCEAVAALGGLRALEAQCPELAKELRSRAPVNPPLRVLPSDL